jgi:hypothetical protein
MYCIPAIMALPGGASPTISHNDAARKKEHHTKQNAMRERTLSSLATQQVAPLPPLTTALSCPSCVIWEGSALHC